MTYNRPSRTIADSQGEQRVLPPQGGGDRLDLLIESEGEIVTRTDMRTSICGHKVVSKDRISLRVYRLTKQLKSSSEPSPWQIETIPKRDYQLPPPLNPNTIFASGSIAGKTDSMTSTANPIQHFIPLFLTTISYSLLQFDSVISPLTLSGQSLNALR